MAPQECGWGTRTAKWFLFRGHISSRGLYLSPLPAVPPGIVEWVLDTETLGEILVGSGNTDGAHQRPGLVAMFHQRPGCCSNMSFQVPSRFDEIALNDTDLCPSQTAVPDAEQVQASRLASEQMSK